MDYYTFNFIEMLFWVVLGFIAYTLRNLREQRYRQLAIYASAALVVLGLSDAAEILYGSFLQADLGWLLIWKITNVAAIIYGFLWYLYLRLGE